MIDMLCWCLGYNSSRYNPIPPNGILKMFQLICNSGVQNMLKHNMNSFPQLQQRNPQLIINTANLHL